MLKIMNADSDVHADFQKMQILADAEFWIEMWIFADADVAFTLEMRMLKNCKWGYLQMRMLHLLKKCGCRF